MDFLVGFFAGSLVASFVWIWWSVTEYRKSIPKDENGNPFIQLTQQELDSIIQQSYHAGLREGQRDMDYTSAQLN